MKYPSDERHGEHSTQGQGEQGNRQLRVTEAIVLLEHRDMRRPHAKGEAIGNKKLGNRFFARMPPNAASSAVLA
jgi:hypothetical protein